MGYQAILSGTYADEPLLEFLPENHELSSGNKVYTSGKGGIFLEGIPIGEVKLVEEKTLVSLFSNFFAILKNFSLNQKTVQEGICIISS